MCLVLLVGDGEGEKGVGSRELGEGEAGCSCHRIQGGVAVPSS